MWEREVDSPMVSSLIRYLDTYREFLRTSALRAMEYRLNFFGNFLIDLVFFATVLGFFEVIFMRTSTLGGWDRSQIRLFQGTMFMWMSLQDGVYFVNLMQLPHLIRRGDLDLVLTKPLNPLFILSLRRFDLGMFCNIVVGLIVILYGFNTSAVAVSGLTIALYAGLLINGIFITYCILSIFMLCAFWTIRAEGIFDIYKEVNHVTKYPDVIYSAPVKLVFTYAMPLLVIVNFPVRSAFGELPLMQIGYAFSVSLLLFALLQCVWKLGLRRYQSASS